MTFPALENWPPGDGRRRRSEVSAVVGSGDAVWERVARDVLRWKVKTASGFRVDAPGQVSAGDRVTVTAHFLGLSIEEPVEVTSVLK